MIHPDSDALLWAVTFTIAALALLRSFLPRAHKDIFIMPVPAQTQDDIQTILSVVQTLAARPQGDPQAVQDLADTVEAVKALRTDAENILTPPAPVEG